MLGAGLLAQADAAQLYSEPFTGGSSGWKSNSLNVAFLNNVVRYRFAPGPFDPAGATLIASNGASGGAFVGNYVTAGVKAITFSAISTANVPSTVILHLQSGSNAVFRNLVGQFCATGRWMTIAVSLESAAAGGWFEATPGLFGTVVSNVTEVRLQISPNPSPAVNHIHLIDNFTLTNASAIQAVAPSFQAFGEVVTGQTAQATFVITNSGTLSMTGFAFTVGGAFSLASPSNYVLDAGAWTSVVVSFSPSSNAAFAGQVNFLSNGGSLGVPLTGQGVGVPILGVTPLLLPFGNVITGTLAEAAYVLTNAGGSLLTGSLAGISAPFALPGGTTFALTAGAATSLVVRFAPPAAGLSSNAVVFLSNGGAFTGAVTGTGLDAPLLGVSPTLVDFASVIVGAWSDAVFVVTNRGSQVLSGVALVAPPFSVLTGGDYALEPGASTSTVVRFTPTSAATVTNALDFLSNGGSSTSRLVGTGFNAPLLGLDPPSFDFGSQPTGQTSQATLIISNRGSALLTGTVEVPGPTFGIILGDSYTLLPGEWQQLIVGFIPVAVQSYSNNLVFDSNAGASTNALTGTGILPAQLGVSPGSHDFGALPVLDSAQALFVVTNSGQAGLTGTVVAVGAPYAVTAGTDFTLAPGQAASVLVTFSPTQSGSFPGGAAFLSNGGQVTNLLSGSAFQPTAEATNVFAGLSTGAVSLVFEVTSGAWYHVEASTNLLDPSAWVNVSATNRASSGTVLFLDASPSAPQRTYRLRSP